MPAAAALAPVTLDQEKSADTLAQQAHVLWSQFDQTAAAVDGALTKAQADTSVTLTREELKTMIMLRLRLRELATRRSLHQEELTSLQAELAAAQSIARQDKFADTLADFIQQADKFNGMLANVLATMNEMGETLIMRAGA